MQHGIRFPVCSSWHTVSILIALLSIGVSAQTIATRPRRLTNSTSTTSSTDTTVIFPGQRASLRSLTISPSSISCGTQALVTTGPIQTVTVANYSTHGLTVQSVSVNNAAFIVSTPATPMYIGRGQSMQIQVRFAPAVVGDTTGTLSIASTSGTLPYTVILTGTGFSPQPLLALSTASLDLGNTAVGTVSSLQYVSLRNPGAVNTTV